MSRQSSRAFMRSLKRILDEGPLIPPKPPPKLLGYRIAAIHDQHDGTIKISWLTIDACQQFMADWSAAQKRKPPDKYPAAQKTCCKRTPYHKGHGNPLPQGLRQ